MHCNIYIYIVFYEHFLLETILFKVWSAIKCKCLLQLEFKLWFVTSRKLTASIKTNKKYLFREKLLMSQTEIGNAHNKHYHCLTEKIRLQLVILRTILSMNYKCMHEGEKEVRD